MVNPGPAWPAVKVARFVFWVLASLCLATLALILLTETPSLRSGSAAIPMAYTALVALNALAFAVLPVVSASRVALVSLTAAAVSGLGHAVPEVLSGRDAASVLMLVRHETYAGVLIVVMYLAARGRHDQAKAQLAARRLASLAYEDVLTGLPNRRRIEGELARQVEIAGRYQRPLSLILFDIDRFKAVNDSHGHKVGDEVLCSVAMLVTSHLRAGDTFGRWGGEEFLIVTPETGLEQAAAMAERIRGHLAQQSFRHQLRLTASFGLALHAPGLTAGQVLEQADHALYQAKQAGRNRVVALPHADSRAATADPTA